MITTLNLPRLLRILPVLVLVLILAASAAAAAGDDDPEVRMNAAREALNKAKYRQAAELYNEVFLEAREANLAGNALYWEAFARYRLNRTEELKRAVELLALQQEKYQESETATEADALLTRIYGELAQRGEARAAREVRSRLDDDEVRAETQMAALHALMQMDPEKARPVLEKIVRGEKVVGSEMRRSAIFMMCNEGDDQSEDLLIDLLQTTTDTDLQSDLVHCLSNTGSDRALDALVEFFNGHKGSDLGEEALFAIGEHGGDRAFDLLTGLVADAGADEELRAQALFSLSQTGRDEEVAGILTKILATESSPKILEMALYSLSNLDSGVPEQIFIDLIKNPSVDEDLRTQALFFAAERGQISLEFIRNLYDRTESRDMKQQICHILTQMDDQSAALDALVGIVRREKDPEIRRDAVFWVGQFDDPRAAEFLLEIINEE